MLAITRQLLFNLLDSAATAVAGCLSFPLQFPKVRSNRLVAERTHDSLTGRKHSWDHTHLAVPPWGPRPVMRLRPPVEPELDFLQTAVKRPRSGRATGPLETQGNHPF